MGERIRGRAGVKLRARRLARSGGLCEDCKAKSIVREAKEVDHIVPLKLGGLDVDENTRNLCRYCHDRRTAEQFNQRRKVEISLSGWPVEE